MTTAFLAEGNAVVRSGFARCFAINGEWSSFCSTATGLLGRTALEQKKKAYSALFNQNGLRGYEAAACADSRGKCGATPGNRTLVPSKIA